MQVVMYIPGVFPSDPDDPNKKKHYSFLVCLNMAASNLHAILAALVSLPERLGYCLAISYSSLQLLQGGLLGEGEYGQLALQPQPTHQQ